MIPTVYHEFHLTSLAIFYIQYVGSQRHDVLDDCCCRPLHCWFTGWQKAPGYEPCLSVYANAFVTSRSFHLALFIIHCGNSAE